jgi:hypothetical protein
MMGRHLITLNINGRSPNFLLIAAVDPSRLLLGSKPPMTAHLEGYQMIFS